MKAIKLFLVFTVILGAIILAFFIIPDSGDKALSPIPDNTHEMYRKQFISDWEQKGDWDKDLFLSHYDIVKQLSTQYNTRSLEDLNTKTATEIVYNKIFEEWKSTGCNKTKIDNYINAIRLIESKDQNAISDPNVKKIQDVYASYLSAYNYIHKNIGLVPHFDGNSWNSYSAYKNSILSQRQIILSNANYKAYLSNISDIKNGLENIPNKLSTGKTSFYQSLAYKIKSYYNKDGMMTMDNLRRLRNVVSKYTKEFGKNSMLSSFVSDFAYNVNQQSSWNYE